MQLKAESDDTKNQWVIGRDKLETTMGGIVSNKKKKEESWIVASAPIHATPQRI